MKLPVLRLEGWIITGAVALVASSGVVMALRAGKPANGPGSFTPLSKQHAGAVVRMGDRFVELQSSGGGRVEVHILDRDETTLFPIAVTELKAEVQPWTLEEEPRIVHLHAAPLPGENRGACSTFVGQLPPNPAHVPQSVGLTIPVEGKTYRVALRANWHPPGHIEGGPPMPAGAGAEQARDLYLKPGGRYTLQDIRANGNQTAAQKFAGFQAAHDPAPKSGDWICPITRTKANPRVAWIIGGKKYLFCCPPCVDEFLKRAKEKSGAIPDPTSFLKK